MLLGEDRTVDADPNSAMANDFENVMGRTVGGVHVPRIPTNLSISDLFEYRIRIEMAKRLDGLPKNVLQATVQLVMNQLLAPELADAYRLYLNRALGNGRGANIHRSRLGQGPVDEPGEIGMSL